MQPFRTLAHTADVGFEAFSSTREEVFANSARALMNIVVDLDAIEPAASAPIQTSSADAESLLMNWLSEILYLQDAEGWIFRDFEIRRLDDAQLEVVARGEKFEREKPQTKLLVKAITDYQLAVEQTSEGWRTHVYVDI